MSRITAGFAALLIAAGLAAPAGAQAKHADYSGVWVMDAAKSTGDMLPSAATWTVAQHGDTIITDREIETPDAVNPTKTHFVVTTDGNPTSNAVPSAGAIMETSSTAGWDSTGVVIKTSGNAQGYDFVLTDHWTLSPDGKVLVSDRVITVGGQVVQTNTLTFNRKT